MKYAVVFEKAANNWGAYVPDLPGCVTTAPTLDDARRLIAEAIEFHIEGLRLHGHAVPAPTTVAETVEVKAGEVTAMALAMLADEVEDGAVSEARSRKPRSTLGEVEAELRRKSESRRRS